jgi:hypothetical protein
VNGSLFCPPGSASPSVASAGFYTTPAHLDKLGGVSGGGSASQSGVLPCPKGSFCPGDGTARLCPGGTYGHSTRLENDECSGPCAAGHFCPAGSTSFNAHACWADQKRPEERATVHCPVGSRAPVATQQGISN